MVFDVCAYMLHWYDGIDAIPRVAQVSCVGEDVRHWVGLCFATKSSGQSQQGSGLSALNGRYRHFVVVTGVDVLGTF